MKVPVRRIHVILYGLIAIVLGIAYWHVRSALITNVPEIQVISNLTVNYVGGSFLTGGLSGWWIYERLLRNAKMIWRLIGTVFFVLIVAIGWMILMSMGGYHLRWG